jgi:ABC-2 type transport system permease protein
VIAIFRREVAAYFNSATAWVLMGVYMFVLGMMYLERVVGYSEESLMAGSSPFGAPVLSVGDRVVVPLFWWMGFLLLFMVPVLTMRLIAEESRNGTLEMLFTYPLTDVDIVLGKFAAAMTVVLAMMGLSLSMFIALGQLVTLEWKVIACGMLGVFLVGCNYVSFGMWASSISSTQVVAAVLTYGGLLSSWLVGFVARDAESVKETFGELTVFDHLQQMARGTLSTHQMVYFAAWTALFLFLTVRMLESRKWSA